ncbi:MAG: transport protein TonB, partial [Verrucomicrobia bacterium]|nr:transport protein TonB [Verrucomicrobiota bacterium]
AGRARLPRIVSATDPAFGWSALQAIAEWRFVPPRRGGKEEIVRARIPFDFNGPVAEARKP